MGILLAAGAVKLADLDAFSTALQSWELLPAWSLGMLAIATPSIEVLLAGSWFLGIQPKLARLGAITFLAIASLLYVGHLVFASPPDCGCLGEWLKFDDARNAQIATLVRNGSMLVALGAGVALDRRWRAERDGPASNREAEIWPSGARIGDRHPTSHGFSLIETVITVALIGILLAMLAPNLGAVRQHAAKIQSLSNLRQHGTMFHIYANDHDGEWPWYTDPDADVTILRGPGFAVPVDGYWGGAASWQYALHGYYDADLSDRRLFLSNVYGNPGFYWYSHSFIADPDYWRPESRLSNRRSQLRSTRRHEVNDPGKKGLFLDAGSLWGRRDHPLYARDPLLIGFADASAQAVKRERVGAPYPGGPGEDEGPFAIGIPVMHTVGGVQGRDIP